MQMARPVQLQRNESLLQRNTLALAARADAYVEVDDRDALGEALSWARRKKMPVLPLGEGSNIVFAGDVRALLVRQTASRIQELARDKESATIAVDAGMNWHQLVCWSLQQDLFGLENLALIPGSVGAAPVQNIGAYGVELESFVEAVHGVNTVSGEALTLSRADCLFAYRDSIFKGELRDRVIITRLDLRLSRSAHVEVGYPALAQRLTDTAGSEPSPRQVFDAVVDIRSSKLPDPARTPNAGSFFKNPLVEQAEAARLAAIHPSMPQFRQDDGRVKLAAAWLIDQCGWKGHRENGVGVLPGHALVLANYTATSGQSLLALAQRIERSVLQAFGVVLEIEPRVYGRSP